MNKTLYTLNPERNFAAVPIKILLIRHTLYLTNGNYENYRNRVINSTLTTGSNYTWQDMETAKQQFKFVGKRNSPTLLSNITLTDDKEAVAIYNNLKSWNYYADYPLTTLKVIFINFGN